MLQLNLKTSAAFFFVVVVVDYCCYMERAREMEGDRENLCQ